MKVIFKVPENDYETIQNITNTLENNCESKRVYGFDGKTIIDLVAIVVPVVWVIVEMYLSNPTVTIEFVLNDQTVIVSDRSYTRAQIKVNKIKDEWVKEQTENQLSLYDAKHEQ